MKILLYIPTMTKGGAERVMSVLAGGLSRRGHEVLMVNDFRDQSRWDCYPVAPGVRRLYLAEENAGNRGVKNVRRIMGLRRIARAEGPDVVLSFLGNPNQRMLLAMRGVGARKVVSVRNDPNREYGPGRLRRAWVNWLFRGADGVVFQTEEASRYFREDIRERSRVMPNPVDGAFYSAKRAENPRDVVSVGRLASQKNYGLLIRAFARIASDCPGDNLVIYGEGDLRGELEGLARRLGLALRVFLPGSVEDVAGVLAGAKAFVLSSDYEGLPNALMEAMAVGLPCIATDCPCGGPRELIESGTSGILVPVGDEGALARSMKAVLDDGGARERLAAGARERAAEFETEGVIDRWEEFLTQGVG